MQIDFEAFSRGRKRLFRATTQIEQPLFPSILTIRITEHKANGIWLKRGMGIWNTSEKIWQFYGVRFLEKERIEALLQLKTLTNE